jgi:mRNA-degrading endonuclease toxin of MazEF toxin-antitoxin module
MTSRAKAAGFDPPFLVPISGSESGLRRDGWAKCDQPMTLPTTLLGRRAGRLTGDTMVRVAAALRFVLDLGG